MTRVADLVGAELALWVAKALGRKARIKGDIAEVFETYEDGDLSHGWAWFAPHEDWAHGGPLIEKHLITLGWQPMKGEWMAGATSATMLEFRWLGFHASPLIAAMRALVASVYGNEVTA